MLVDEDDFISRIEQLLEAVGGCQPAEAATEDQYPVHGCSP
jgi:hypothetical protein